MKRRRRLKMEYLLPTILKNIWRETEYFVWTEAERYLTRGLYIFCNIS